MTEAMSYQVLLEQKKELVFELLRLSNDLELKADAPDEAVERYAEFVAAREGLIANLRALDGELDAVADRPEETEETRTLTREAQAMADQVIRLEPEIRRKALGLSAHYQKRLRIIDTRRQEAQSRGEYTKGLRYQNKA